MTSAWLGSLRQMEVSQLPKRLLDVGNVTATQVRVVHPKKACSYLTVSHCWGRHEEQGSAKPYRQLNKHTYDQLSNGSNDRCLPRLFRDCVQVARRLRVRFVWIDALCILQDDDNDKKEEILRMGSIYAGSSCNIAAVSAKDSDSSLFTRLLPLSQIRKSLHGSQSANGAIFEISEYERNLPITTPLFDRAWVVQERLLAHYVLEYTHLGIIGQRVDDSGPEGSIPASWPSLFENWKKLLALRKIVISEEDKIRGQFAWSVVVREYAKAKFTHETDRPFGLLGVISVLQERTGLSFSHGVCKDFFPYSIFWKMGTPRNLSDQRRYEGPSWSNTFRERPSYYEENLWHGDIAQLYHSECSVDGDSALMNLCARCSNTIGVEGNSGWREIVYDGLSATIFVESDYEGPFLNEVDLVLLAENTHGCIFGLVLSKLSDENDVWERLGMFKLYSNEWEKVQGLSGMFKNEKTYLIR